MKVVHLSDTHNSHESLLRVPDGDVLVHTGDFTNEGTYEEVSRFLAWFSLRPHEQKLLIAGNHESGLDRNNKRFDPRALGLVQNCAGVTYLEDETVAINGVVFYGSPRMPDYHWTGLPFGYCNDGGAEAAWSRIPADVDVLLTHTPPFGVMDAGSFEPSIGCDILSLFVMEKVRPRLHLFGHCHDSYGVKSIGATLFGNSALRDSKADTLRAPQVFEISEDIATCYKPPQARFA